MSSWVSHLCQLQQDWRNERHCAGPGGQPAGSNTTARSWPGRGPTRGVPGGAAAGERAESFLLLPLLRVRAIMALVEMAMDRRDAIYAELGVPPEEPEDPLDRWRRMKAEREEPQPRERKLDTAPPTLDDVDRRNGEWIAAEHEFMIDVLGEVLAQLQSDAEMRGPPGPAGPRGEQGPPGLLAMVKLWVPETVYYAGDVVAYDGGTFQAQRDTGSGRRSYVRLVPNS
jgi:hypothetical protein